MEKSKSAGPATMNNLTEFNAFRLVDGIQVRREKFGLLFYNYRGPRIYFLPSRGLIGADFFDGKQTIGHLADFIQREHDLPRANILDRLSTILQALEAKGLIDGQPLC